MHVFRLFEEGNPSESDFRWWYREVEQRTMRCCTISADDVACSNDCEYLIAFDLDATRDGYPSVHGLDCDVEVLCWGGHSDETTEEVYCSECARRQHQYRCARQQEAELEAEMRRTAHEREQLLRTTALRAREEHWRMLGALSLENECADLFRQIGFTASTTARTNDGNIDIVLEKDGRRGAAQCKAWRKPCGVRIVREFLGTVYANNFDFGYLIARSGFTPTATELLRRLPMIEAWDVCKLVTVSRAPESPV